MSKPPPLNPALSDENSFLLRVLGEAPARLWVKDATGRYAYVNSEVTRILGVPREKFIGSTDEELFPTVGHVYWRKDQTCSLDRAAAGDHRSSRAKSLSLLSPVPPRSRWRTACGHARCRYYFAYFRADGISQSSGAIVPQRADAIDRRDGIRPRSRLEQQFECLQLAAAGSPIKAGPELLPRWTPLLVPSRRPASECRMCANM